MAFWIISHMKSRSTTCRKRNSSGKDGWVQLYKRSINIVLFFNKEKRDIEL
jgi:hypothetical protein